MRAALLAFLPAFVSLAFAGPELLDDQFELARGFHIYRAAGPDLSGGSYALTFDGEGRLLVGDGNAVRRLKDPNDDGVFDSFEVIASGLGWRGPQGLLVDRDRLFAVGGDGIQLYEGYRSGGPLKPKGRIGGKFLTGGDHDAHTIFRGHDGYIYFMAGNGAGISRRTHITEKTSPVLNEREASVFRISPDGAKWECIGSGGRNPPNLGMNYLGELFSFDSDMEWHVGLPWYRPVRLNHWTIGGDQGWQEVGAYPPYYIDCLPGILDVGRGSPTWGRFYEHTQFPGKFRNAFLVCDYRWKRESNDQYATTGRLVAFFLKRKGATWAADMETLARPKPGARDRNGTLINFALVDVEVAPDGSLFVSDHNQGIWRIYFGAPGPVRNPFPRNSRKADPLQELLSLPQPGAEWSRVRAEAIRSHGGADLEMQVRAVAANKGRPLEHRLRAIRLLESNFAALSDEFIQLLARDKVPEVRGQAAYLLGIRGKNDSVPLLCKMAGEGDPFVRRRAAEALTRFGSAESTDALIERLGDTSRLIRYTAMIALAHQPTPLFFNKAAVKREPETRMRALVAASLRGELPPWEDIQRVINPLLDQSLFPEEHLDLLRVLGIFHNEITNQPVLHARVVQHLAGAYPGSTRDLRWEQIRLIGQYQVSHAFSRLLRALETDRYPVTQFHIAQTIARLPAGWSIAEEERLFKWLASTQRGWFAEFSGKGVEFPEFWTTVLSDFAAHHPEIMMRNFGRIDLGSLLGTVAIDLVAHEPDGTKRLIGLYRTQRDTTRVKVLAALGGAPPSGEIAGFCRSEYGGTTNSELKGALVKTLARQNSDPADVPLFIEGMAQRQIEVVRACASALAGLKPKLDETQAAFAITRMAENSELCRTIEPLLVASTRENPPGLDQPPSDSVRAIRVQFWRAWFEKQFSKPFPAVAGKREKSDSELIEFLLSDRAKGGDPIRGGKVYELAQCNTCHGGGAAPGREGRLFGPDLAGATRRLTPREFAESLVYPSRQVAERYRAWEITLKDGILLTGFITEQNDAAVTLADRNQVQRMARADIESIRPQTTSLMPDHLLNGLGSEQIRDLLAFLDQGPASPRR